ncbi:MAG: hypothetical protein ACNA8W_25385, partial [Bradymonadaceae bacterium]
MDLGKVAARLRIRNGYESVDLGVLLARRFAWPLWSAWIVCVLPFFVVAWAICMLTGRFWLPLFILWWLKPLFARVPLFVLSRGFFGDVPGPKQTARQMPRSWFRGATFLQLFLFRFSPFRGFSMIVTDLEGSGFSASRSRLKVLLGNHIRVPSAWLHGVALAAEMIIFTAC